MNRQPIKRKICSEEGCDYPVWARGRCKAHDYKLRPRDPQKYQKKVSEKREKQIEANKIFYKRAIALNIIKNKGVCRCDECGEEIKAPKWRNVAHILSLGAHPAIYHDDDNLFILGAGSLFNQCECGPVFDNSTKSNKMKIFPIREERKVNLKNKYYANSTDSTSL